MPVMDGFTLLERIQNENRKIITIILTAYNTEENREAALRLGAFKILEKPV